MAGSCLLQCPAMLATIFARRRGGWGALRKIQYKPMREVSTTYRSIYVWTYFYEHGACYLLMPEELGEQQGEYRDTQCQLQWDR